MIIVPKFTALKILTYISRILKVLFGGFIVLFVVLNLSGCFQFRQSNEKRIREFKSEGLSLSGDSYTYLEHTINYVHTGYRGDSLKPILLFVHGSPGSSKDFKKSLKDTSLRTRFEMISVDRPGFGYSNFGVAETVLDKQVLALSPLLQQLKGRKVIIAGHSYGGAVAARAAMLFPDALAGCMIIAGSVSADAEPSEPWRKVLAYPVFRWMIPKAFRVSNSEILTLKSDLRNMENGWRNIRMPVTVLQGKKDRLVSPENADFVERMAVNSTSLRVYRIDKVDHFIPFMQEYLIRDAALEMSADW